MPTVKTAISIERSLFEQADATARALNLSRSHLFALALAEFLQRHENQKLLDAINVACEELPAEEELAHAHAMRRHHRELVERAW